MSHPIIAVIGSLNIDLVSRVSRVPAGGETLIAQSFDTGSGGKGANQAVACARLSRSKDAIEWGILRVQMFGSVGDDLFGKNLVQDLKSNGIDTEGVAVMTGEKTGVAVIIVEESGENRIIMSPNSNYSLRPNHFLDLKTPLADLIVLQLEIPRDTVLQILKMALHYKIDVLLNPAPAQVLPKEAYEAVTHLIVNESEAATITGNEGKDIDWLSDNPERKELLNLGPQHIIVTLGSKGGSYTFSENGKTHFYKAKNVQVRDTTAAGDTFVGAYAVAMLANKERSFEAMAQAVDWANEAASITVQREGAQVAIPWMEEVGALQNAS